MSEAESQTGGQSPGLRGSGIYLESSGTPLRRIKQGLVR